MAIALASMFTLLLGAFRIPASIPIFFISYRRSPKVAMIAGIVVGFVVLLVRPLYLHPVVFIEAPVEYLMIALSGYFPPQKGRFKNSTVQWLFDRRGIFIAATLRFLVTLVGSYIIYSYYFQMHGPVIWGVSLLDEGPLFIPYILLALVLVPELTKYRYQVHELK